MSEATEVARQVDAVLDVLAERFGGTAEQVFETLVGYYLALGWAFLIGGAVLCLAGSILGFSLYKDGKREEEDSLMLGGVLAAFFANLIGVALLCPGIYYLASPTTHAIRELLGAL